MYIFLYGDARSRPTPPTHTDRHTHEVSSHRKAHAYLTRLAHATHPNNFTRTRTLTHTHTHARAHERAHVVHPPPMQNSTHAHMSLSLSLSLSLSHTHTHTHRTLLNTHMHRLGPILSALPRAMQVMRTRPAKTTFTSIAERTPSSPLNPNPSSPFSSVDSDVYLFTFSIRSLFQTKFPENRLLS